MENEIEKIIEEKLGKIKLATEKIIRLSGQDYKSDYIEWRFLKALQYGTGNFQTVQRYFESHGIKTTENDIHYVASKLVNEGLIEKDIEFVKKAKMAKSQIIEPYWCLTDNGRQTINRDNKE